MQTLKILFITALLGWTHAASAAPPRLVAAQPFTLEQAHTYTWLAGAPAITQGTIVVVKVDTEDAQVRQVGSPVLYVGAAPAERANNGDLDGAIVAFVPDHIDLSITPIFWGPSTLPELVTPKAATETLASTKTQAATPPEVQAASKPAVQLSDTAALYRHLADLIDTHAPSEKERARAYRFERR